MDVTATLFTSDVFGRHFRKVPRVDKTPKVCVHRYVATEGTETVFKTCGLPVFAGSLHGFLCEQHYKSQEDQSRKSIKSDPDREQVESIIEQDRLAIRRSISPNIDRVFKSLSEKRRYEALRAKP